jgi:hypothetical protein
VLFSLTAAAQYANNGIWLQSVNSGNQAWAYYPYDPAHPLTGGVLCPKNNGTSYFNLTPGTGIYRKYVVRNDEPYNDSVSFVITGLPSDWGLTYTTFIPMVLNYVEFPSVGLGAQKSHQGFGGMVVRVPANAAPGKYTYTIRATSGTGYKSNLTDTINVGTGGLPSPSPSPSPSPGPSPSPSPSPIPGDNQLFDPGFELGSVADGHWYGTPLTNYMKRNVEVTTAMAHNGTYSLHNKADDRYARLYQMVTYGGNGFEASYWFYATKSWPVKGSVWLDLIDNSTKGYDDESHYRGVGMDNRTWSGKYYLAMNQQGSIRLFVNNSSNVFLPADGWYKGVIQYDGNIMYFAILDSSGNVVCQSSRKDPGFIPVAVIAVAGCPGFYIDDLSYRTW